MTKFAVPLLAAICVLGVAPKAHAALITIGCSTNDYGAEGATCTVDQCVDTGDPARQLVAEAIACGQRGRCGVADLRLVSVCPHQNLERQIERCKRCAVASQIAQGAR